jgi:hypothetical protein
MQTVSTVSTAMLAKATYAYSFFVRLYGHRGSCKGARQLVGHKGGVFKRLFDRNLYFMAHTGMPDVPNVHARQTRLPRCKCNQHRRRRRRWYPTATGVVGHIELLGTVAARAVFSSNPPSCSKLLLSTSVPDFKAFRQNVMATGPRTARVRTNAGERGLHRSRTGRRLVPSALTSLGDKYCKM